MAQTEAAASETGDGNFDDVITTPELEPKNQGKGNDNNNKKNNNSSNKPSPENKEAKIDSNGGISGDEIIEIVKEFGDTNLQAVVKRTGKTIEASLKNNAKLFDSLAQGQEKELLIKRGIKCGLEEDVAAGLALELMKKYPKSTGM